MDEQQQWYVTIAGNAVGPVSTDLVLRGIKHRKIATEAYVCVVGASEWLALTDVPEFHGALKENGLLPVSESQSVDGLPSEPVAVPTRASQPMSSVGEDDEFETTSQFSSRRLMDSTQAPQPSAEAGRSTALEDQSEVTHVALLASKPGSEPARADGATDPDLGGRISSVPAFAHGDGSTHGSSDSTASTIESAAVAAPGSAGESSAEPDVPPSGPRNGKHSATLEAQVTGIEVDIDVHITMDEPETPAIDWNRGFSEYFLVDADVTLPDEQLLLRSLTTTSHDTFLHDEPMWNLALCLAFGSNAVASVAADVFFDVVVAHAQYERIEWMARTLLSRGFMPSGIPHAAGNQAIGRLRQACPDELRVQLESQLGM